MPIAKDPEKLLSSLEANLLSRYRYGSVLQRLAQEIGDLEAQKRDIEARLTAATQSRDEAQNGFSNIETSIQEIRGEIVAAGADVDLMHRVAEARLNVLIESKVLDPDAPILMVKTSRGRGRPKTIKVGTQTAARGAGKSAEANQTEATEAEQAAEPVEPVKPAEAPKAVEPVKPAEAPKAVEPPPVVMPARRAAKPVVVEGDDVQVEPETKLEQDANPAAASPKPVEQPAPPVVMPSPRQRPAVITPEPQPRQADESANHAQATPAEPDLDLDNPMAGILDELFPGVG